MTLELKYYQKSKLHDKTTLGVKELIKKLVKAVK